ncbi:MAG: dienelactone hydrolase family protein [Sandaracinaceae bacterium]|nr:dienelactone hydrolase family protein [Sandaracinaceae bacterium]
MLRGYERRSFTADAAGHPVTHDVYWRGAGTPVVLIQELPGIGPETLRLADALVEAGHLVVLPHLFGPLGRVSTIGNTARILCMRKELTLFSQRSTSPVVDWLRALCRDVRERHDARGVGVIGMCLTGNFAFSLIADESVLAAVASQPSMPILSQDSLHMSDADVAASRAALDDVGPMLAFRFEKDPLCAGAKFRALDRAFNDDAERIRLVTLPGRGHSVLTLDFVDAAGHPTREALDSVLTYFGERL